MSKKRKKSLKNILKRKGKDYVKDLMFYLLTVYGFNNQIRFNSKGEYNIPVGKRDFNLNIRSNLSDFIDSIKKNDIIFINKDFRDFEWKSLNQDFLNLDITQIFISISLILKRSFYQKNIMI